jgi:antitoxin (DNA-binding transcriptional repressor) of toxin-antitoxin stability system
MVTISFTQFRQHAKNYFDAVEKGEIVRILRRGKLIAQIVPPTPKGLSFKKNEPQITLEGVSLSQAILAERTKNR